jgi:hypothetical protein
MSITFQKRQKELKRQEKQRAKAERREQRRAARRAEVSCIFDNTHMSCEEKKRLASEYENTTTKLSQAVGELRKGRGIELNFGRHLPTFGRSDNDDTSKQRDVSTLG